PGALPGGGRCALVPAPPPSLPLGSAHSSTRPQWAACHLEQRGGVEAFTQAAARLLAPPGWFVTCAAAAQVERVALGAARAGLAVVRRMDVVPREGKEVLFSMWAMRRRHHAGPLRVDRALVVRDRLGRWTEQSRALRPGVGLPAWGCRRRGAGVLWRAMAEGDTARPERGGVAGIDVGATLCKVALRRDGLSTARYPSSDLAGARALIEAWSPSRIIATGGGADRLGAEIAGVPVEHVSEFDAWSREAVLGAAEEGIALPERYLLVSLGTGTSVLRIDDGRVDRVGGTALGGGTVVGLGKLLLGLDSFAEVAAMAERGDRRSVDLLVGDIYRGVD